MAIIELRNIWHSYDLAAGKTENPKFAVENINMTYEDGAAIALLGPSGCGKTTLLEIISGLLVPTKGQVFFDGIDVTKLTARERHIAQVFQFPVVYESMSVYGNIAFPLQNDGMEKSKIKKRVHEVVEILEIENLINMPVSGLTPADKQKVSLGRGIVRPNTAAVLLDEPLTVIDPKAQWGLRRKLKQVQKELNFTMIYVTHDQHEALTFAEKVTVMDVGKICQTATPKKLHEEPENTFVGFFIGSPGMNLFDVEISEDGVLKFDGTNIPIPSKTSKELLSIGGNLTLGIRPEYINTYSSDEKSDCISGKVKLVEDNGAYQIITTTFGNTNIKSRADESLKIKEGDKSWLYFQKDSIKFFKDGERVDIKSF